MVYLPNSHAAQPLSPCQVDVPFHPGAGFLQIWGEVKGNQKAAF